MGVGQSTPWTSRQLIAGPLLMAVEGANCASGAIWGSVSCSRILRHVAQSRPGEPGIWTGDLLVTSPQLYPLSYSRPWWAGWGEIIRSRVNCCPRALSQIFFDRILQYRWCDVTGRNGGVFFFFFFLTDTASKYKTKLYVSNSGIGIYHSFSHLLDLLRSCIMLIFRFMLLF